MSSFFHRRSTRAFGFIVAAVIGLLFTVISPAHAGVITCGDGQTEFDNRTNPSSQVHIYGSTQTPPLPIQGCSQYNDILTISGDTVFLDEQGAYVMLSPRVACDIARFGYGFTTYRNYSYTSNGYAHIGFVGQHNQYTVTLCNTF